MEKTRTILDFIIEQCEQTASHYDRKERNSIMLFSLSMIDRLNFSANGLKVLLSEINSNKALEYSCGITIRAILLDYMIILNGIAPLLSENSVGNEKENLDTYCSKWLADSIEHSMKNIQLLYSEKSNNELKTMYSNIAGKCSDWFSESENDRTPPKSKLEKPERNETLYQNIKKGIFKRYAKLYEAYLWYSKYDHFGQMFYEISRTSFTDRLEKIERLIQFFPNYLHYSLFILDNASNHTDNYTLTKKDEILSFIDEWKIDV